MENIKIKDKEKEKLDCSVVEAYSELIELKKIRQFNRLFNKKKK